MALASVNKFLLYGFIAPGVPRAGDAVNRVARAATRCRFEPISRADDEATLMRLLELCANVVRCAAGAALSDAAVWDVTQCCFVIARIPHASALLQRTAEVRPAACLAHEC